MDFYQEVLNNLENRDKGTRDFTVRYLAVAKGHQESIAVLKELGAKTDICDREHNKTVDELLKNQPEAAPTPAAAM